MYIGLAIAALCIVLLCGALRVEISYNDADKTPNFTLYYYFLRISLTEQLEKLQKPAKPKKEKPPKKEKAEKPKKEKEALFQVRDILDQLDAIFALVKAELLCLRSQVFFKKIRFVVAYSTGDAADTAIQYGAICALVYNFFLLFDHHFRIEEKTISITPLFTEKCFKADVLCLVQIRVYALFLMAGIAAVRAFSIYRKIRKNKKRKVGIQL